MPSDLFDKSPYRLLGLPSDARSAEANAAYARARRLGGPDARRLNEARDTVSRFAPRLALDALVLAPPVPTAVLDALTRHLDAEPAGLAPDPASALLVVPDVAPDVGPTTATLAVRPDLAAEGAALSLEVDR